jgi:hypothetical protein
LNTWRRRIPSVAEPNLVGSSPFSARSYRQHSQAHKRNIISSKTKGKEESYREKDELLQQYMLLKMVQFL